MNTPIASTLLLTLAAASSFAQAAPAPAAKAYNYDRAALTYATADTGDSVSFGASAELGHGIVLSGVMTSGTYELNVFGFGVDLDYSAVGVEIGYAHAIGQGSLYVSAAHQMVQLDNNVAFLGLRDDFNVIGALYRHNVRDGIELAAGLNYTPTGSFGTDSTLDFQVRARFQIASGFDLTVGYLLAEESDNSALSLSAGYNF